MGAESGKRRIPVILDTDIGTDIDDTWALAMLLKSPELDVRLVVSATGDTRGRAKIIAKMLEVAERTDVPVGIGIPFESEMPLPQAAWVKDYDLARYPGTVRQDGVKAMISAIMNSPEPVTLVCIAPLPNVAEALRREPGIVKNCRFVGMHGSVYIGYNGAKEVSAEHNVCTHTRDSQEVFRAPWDMTITPLDTCGLVTLEDEKYQAVLRCDDRLIQSLMENYRLWLESRGQPERFKVQSSTLYDTVAVYLALSEELLTIQSLGIRVTDEGYTVLNDNAKRIRVAVKWKDLPAYEDFLVRRLTLGGTSLSAATA